MKILHVAFLLLASFLSITAQTNKTSKLSGIIYDPNGAVIVAAKVTAVGGGKTYTALSNDDGRYELTLPFVTNAFNLLKYDITVDTPFKGFKRSETKGFAFIQSQFGTMNLDIAVEVAPVQPNVHPIKYEKTN